MKTWRGSSDAAAPARLASRRENATESIGASLSLFFARERKKERNFVIWQFTRIKVIVLPGGDCAKMVLNRVSHDAAQLARGQIIPDHGASPAAPPGPAQSIS